MTGATDNLDAAATLRPGNDVDWISWNVHNQSGCAGSAIDPGKLVSFEDKMKSFYDFVHRRRPPIDIDATEPMADSTGRCNTNGFTCSLTVARRGLRLGSANRGFYGVDR